MLKVITVVSLALLLSSPVKAEENKTLTKRDFVEIELERETKNRKYDQGDWEYKEDYRHLYKQNRKLAKRVRTLERAVVQLQDRLYEQQLLMSELLAQNNSGCHVDLEGGYGDGYLEFITKRKFVYRWRNGRPQAYGTLDNNCRGSFTFPDDRTYRILVDDCRIYFDNKRSGNFWRIESCGRNIVKTMIEDKKNILAC